jgi:hypothetical protein
MPLPPVKQLTEQQCLTLALIYGAAPGVGEEHTRFRIAVENVLGHSVGDVTSRASWDIYDIRTQYRNWWIAQEREKWRKETQKTDY